MRSQLILAATILLFVVIFGSVYEPFDNYLHHKSKCYSCEKQLAAARGLDAVWMAQPTKGFADEDESVAQTGSGWLAKTI